MNDPVQSPYFVKMPSMIFHFLIITASLLCRGLVVIATLMRMGSLSSTRRRQQESFVVIQGYWR